MSLEKVLEKIIKRLQNKTYELTRKEVFKELSEEEKINLGKMCEKYFYLSQYSRMRRGGTKCINAK